MAGVGALSTTQLQQPTVLPQSEPEAGRDWRPAGVSVAQGEGGSVAVKWYWEG